MTELIQPWMLEKIAKGEAILFLGAGASYGACGSKGEKAISGDTLRDNICDHFLGGEEKNKSLTKVADYAKHESSLIDVQNFIKTQFSPLQPAPFHKKIPTFKWHSIFTTNYDLIIERAYDSVPQRLQNLSPIIRDGDKFMEVISDPEQLPYFKLHGCINTINDKNLPLILASEEYAKHTKNRIRLFRHLGDFGKESPIIFCGYQLNDPNIQQILFDLTDEGINRPAYVLVDPGLGKFDIKMWQANRIEPVNATFENFINYLDHNIPEVSRVLAKLSFSKELPISKWLKPSSSLSSQLQQYLDTELEHIYPGIPSAGVNPIDFYKGLDDGWSSIENTLDIKRRVNDQIIMDAVIDENLDGVKTFLLKGHAGSGKSVSLKRVAWDSANEISVPVVRLGEGAVLRPSLLKELILSCDTRLIIIIDDVSTNIDELQKLYRMFNYESFNVSIIFAARNNEWNEFGGELEQYITAEYELNNLSDNEIDALVGKLEHFNCLGNLKNSSLDKVKEHFKASSGSQLLVSLHEATSGKPFEEIVIDEYNHIMSLEAQLLYMDVCTLHRLKVPVRVGLVSRISDINIHDFNNRFLAPLEHVVTVFKDRRSRDFVYVSRHPLIAEFVFNHVLTNPVDKCNQIIRIIKHLDIDYSADEEAFSYLIKGKILADVFGDKSLVIKIYEAATLTGADKSFLLHQHAVYELAHTGCDLKVALKRILEAEKSLEAHRNSNAILHTKGTVYKRLSRMTRSKLEQEKYRGEAKNIFERLVKSQRDSRALNGLAELALDELSEKVELINSVDTDRLEERVLLDLVKKIESFIHTGLQKFPQDEYLLMKKSKLANLLKDSEKAKNILETAYKSNGTSEYISIQLAKQKITEGMEDEGIEILRNGINDNPNSAPLHLAMAKALIDQNNESLNTEIEHHLKRSFSPGDSNYDAQYWFARHQYLYSDRTSAIKSFNSLTKARISPKQKNQLQGTNLSPEGVAVIYTGQIKSEHVSFCFIRCSELASDIYAHQSLFTNLPSDGIRSNVDVSFKLAFTMKGPSAFDVKIKHI